MNINRHNYEEFFLLYVDNELTAAQRRIVDAFVAVNPDLQQEFQQLQHTTFTTDAKLDHDFISSLLKPVAEETSISEEQLLLYVDHELSAVEKTAVEKSITESSVLHKELQLLQHSKLQADQSIVFPDKSLLYREAQPARVFYISMDARRWAAAAVILLLGSAIWLMLDQPTEPQSETVTNNPVVKPVEKSAVNTQNIKEQPQQTVAQQIIEEKENKVATDVHKRNITVKKQDAVIVKNNSVNNSKQNIIQQPTKDDAVIAKVEPPVITDSKNNSTITSNKKETPTVPPKTNTANSISYASYNNDSNADDENTIFTEERQRRSGLKGLVKKVKRTLERKTGIQSNDSEVRFAVFAVNTQ